MQKDTLNNRTGDVVEKLFFSKYAHSFDRYEMHFLAHHCGDFAHFSTNVVERNPVKTTSLIEAVICHT
jgi:hypothetical protein